MLALVTDKTPDDAVSDVLIFLSLEAIICGSMLRFEADDDGNKVQPGTLIGSSSLVCSSPAP